MFCFWSTNLILSFSNLILALPSSFAQVWSELHRKGKEGCGVLTLKNYRGSGWMSGPECGIQYHPTLWFDLWFASPHWLFFKSLSLFEVNVSTIVFYHRVKCEKMWQEKMEWEACQLCDEGKILRHANFHMPVALSRFEISQNFHCIFAPDRKRLQVQKDLYEHF